MAKVARELVEKAGVDFDKLLEMAIGNAAAELTTYCYYTILSVNLIGPEGEVLEEITEDMRASRLETISKRSCLAFTSLAASYRQAWSTFLTSRPARLRPCLPIPNIKDMLRVLVQAKRYAVRGYTMICKMTCGKDHRTYDLSLVILHEEIEHETWFSEFIGEDPSGHSIRKSGEISPYVSKFLGAR